MRLPSLPRETIKKEKHLCPPEFLSLQTNSGKGAGRQEGWAECPEDAGWDMAVHADLMPTRPQQPAAVPDQT